MRTVSPPSGNGSFDSEVDSAGENNNFVRICCSLGKLVKFACYMPCQYFPRKHTSIEQTSFKHPTRASSQPSRPSANRRGTRSQLLPTSAIAVTNWSTVTPRTISSLSPLFSSSSFRFRSERRALCLTKETVRRLYIRVEWISARSGHGGSATE